MREAADSLEATFLSEMLKSAGFGASRTTFGGGVGEDQFGSFLRDAQSKEMVKAGGIGLAEALFEAMKAATND
ncbi:MAG: Rod binding domain-containing protein [Yoonia sp.]|jgi:Rod binding domain-containing protein